MIDQETTDKLLAMRLRTMAEVFRELVGKPAGDLTFEEKVGLMVDREWSERDNRRHSRRIKEAKFPSSASVEDVVTDATRGLDKAAFRALSSCGWVRAKQNVIVLGSTGVGKSFLACALANAACKQGFRSFYVRVPRLVHQLSIARADGSYAAELGRLSRFDVLVLDDFLIAPMKDTERRDLLEVLEDRYDHSATIITSQVPTKTWHEMLADPTIADAICDRLVHNAHVLTLRGQSMRRKKGLDSKDSQHSETKT
jgi:DNA replication protein DnaC